MMNPDLSRFRVAGWDGENRRWTEPVIVTCGRCGASRRFGEFAGTSYDFGASLAELVAWAREHECREDAPVPQRARALAAA